VAISRENLHYEGQRRERYGIAGRANVVLRRAVGAKEDGSI